MKKTYDQDRIFQDAYNTLNKRQQQAVDAIEGPVLVVAGPGSGKTQILSMRVGNILRTTDALPSNILCLTFTESASVNMRQRLTNLIGHDSYRVAIHTFHNFGVEIIERYPEFFFHNATFLPADDLVQVEVITSLLERLEYDNPLKSQHPEQGYTYLNEIQNAIGQLKKAGLTPDEFRALLDTDRASLDRINPWIDSLFSEHLTKSKVHQIEQAIIDLRKQAQTYELPIKTFRPLEEVVADSLENAMHTASDSDSTKPVTAWKQTWTQKNENEKRVFRDTQKIEKMQALADIYQRYMDQMYKRGYYDFDDMLLHVIHAIENNTLLRNDLQEQFRYILVDEFQDTNEAQQRLLDALTSAPVNEGQPNIMAVGDDDQAIYKFQGAEVSNIIHFREQYRDPTVITLTENYRSTQDILDVARFVITKGEDRLERYMDDIEKQLVSSNPHITNGDIVHKIFPTRAHEYSWVARNIRNQIDEGVHPSDIAVIARQHKHLQELLPYLYHENVSLRYERQQNVLHEIHVRQLIQMARFVSTLARKDYEEADYLLPEILAYPFWNIDRTVIWHISVEAYQQRSLWLDSMRTCTVSQDAQQNKKIKNIAEFFIDVATRSSAEPLEYILDYLIGSHVPLRRESDDEQDPQSLRVFNQDSLSMISPFREYYFNAESFTKNKEQYLTFLSSLQVFVDALREYKQGEILSIADLVSFVDLHEENDIPVIDKSPYVNAEDAVQLMTAHKAKGLEFDTVFVLSCIDEVWTPKHRGTKLSFPMNMPIQPSGDTIDDQLRLFYVALTRAKRTLFLSMYKASDTGKEVLPVQFLAPEEHSAHVSTAVQNIITQRNEDPDRSEVPETLDVLSASFATAHKGPFAHEENALLQSLVEDYKMSATHLNNFVNVTKGGPQLFLEQNLLRFPQAKTPSGAFGSAVHKTLELLLDYVRFHKTAPTEHQVIVWFDDVLKKERLVSHEYDAYYNRGVDALRAFYKEKIDTFTVEQQAEINFRSQGVVLGEAQLTGKIDRFIPTSTTTAEVHDYKTGQAKTKWTGGSGYVPIQLHNFKQQLIIYKLLIENSRDYSTYVVERGVLEFVEPVNGSLIDLAYDITEDDVTYTRSLIEEVYRRIVTLDFPDVSTYDQNIKGIKQFEYDLINNIL